MSVNNVLLSGLTLIVHVVGLSLLGLLVSILVYVPPFSWFMPWSEALYRWGQRFLFVIAIFIVLMIYGNLYITLGELQDLCFYSDRGCFPTCVASLFSDYAFRFELSLRAAVPLAFDMSCISGNDRACWLATDVIHRRSQWAAATPAILFFWPPSLFVTLIVMDLTDDSFKERGLLPRLGNFLFGAGKAA